jgi:hypothetical protein
MVRNFRFDAGIEQGHETTGNYQSTHVMPLHKALCEFDHAVTLTDEILIGVTEQAKPFVRNHDAFGQDVIEGFEMRTVGPRRRQDTDVNGLGIRHKNLRADRAL